MPTVSDLDAAMMQPALSVPAVRQLGGGTIRRNDSGRPLRAVGRDAVVYELRTPTGRIVALRCLLRPEAKRLPALAERYVRLAADRHLEPLRAGDGPLPAGMRWIEEGVALPGPDLHRVTAPLIAMERIPGRTLLRAVDRLCREGEGEPIALLADHWLEIAIALETVGFSHGDLAADNLMVRPDGALALVDLDTAWWPEAPAAAPDDGTPGYVHPRGVPADPARRDHFPALILWASLRILARHPDLRQRWGDQPDQDGAALLWSADDLRRPGRSPAFIAIDALDDDTLAPLLEVVRRALRFPPEETPPLSEIADRLASLGVPREASPADWRRRRAWSPPRPTLSGPVTAASDAPDLAWADDSEERVPRPAEREGREPDASHTTTIAEKARRHDAARELGAAVAARDTMTAMRLWERSHTLPEVATHAAAVHQLVAQEVTEVIEKAIRRKDDTALVEAVAAAEVAGVAPTAEARRAVRAARRRIAARTALHDTVARGDLAALAALACSGTLACLGRLEAAHARAVERALAWPALQRALAGDDDAAIAAAVDPALWREEGALPPQARERIDLARARLRWTEDVRAALRRRDGAMLRGLLAAAPPGAEERLTEVESRRILRVSMREAAMLRLERALREGPDREVVSALAAFETAGAPFPDVLDWVAVRGVVDRISLADALREAAAADPPDTARLARLLPAARAALGNQGDPGEPDWAALERSVLRAAHLARLREAIFADDDASIASAADPDPYGTLALLTPDESGRVEQALARARRRG